MRLVARAAAVLFLLAGAVWANDLIPERRLAISRAVDFYGADLEPIFDTSLEGCQRACLADSRCKAFTFNARSNACFPKSAVTEKKPYEGALSGRVFEAGTAVLARAEARAAELTFLGDPDFRTAYALAVDLADLHQTGEWSAQELLQLANDQRRAGRVVSALRYTGAALNLTDAPDQWAEYARLALIAKGQTRTQTNAYRQRAVSGAVNAYLRAASPAGQVAALMVMADALEQVGRGRDMVPALRLAQQIAPREDTEFALDKAIAKYGFRVTEDTVESDAQSPRICAVFSERLVQAGVDYAPFIRLPQQNLAVEVEGSQLCVGGLEHGQRYRLTLREGLPAESGETLVKPVTLTHYVRDRSPAARFPGRAYVLPKAGEAALPVETVNVSELDLVLYAISDRNLLRSIQDQYFGRPLSFWQRENFSSEVAEEVWTGTGEVQMDLNHDVTTRLPMGEVIDKLKPGVYALEARVPGADPYDNPSAIQWFVLSDLGLASMSGADGVHVFVRGLGDAAPKAGVNVTLLSRANAVLAEAETDAAGYAHFAAGLAAGLGGSAPALITAEDGDEDIAFLSLTDPEFDLSDRGVEGREPAGAIDLFLTTDRGAYRAGETVHVTALARDATARAIEGLPLTAVLTRPDGVEYSRHLSDTAAAGGHVFSMPVGRTAPRGTWRLGVFADPDAPALASSTFLVEDFLPERIDFDLTLPEGPISLTDRPPMTIDARYLFGAPGADLAIEGEVLVSASSQLDAFPGYRFGRHDQRVQPRIATLPHAIRTDAAGRAVLPVEFPQMEAVDRPMQARFTVRVSEGSGRPVERRLTRNLSVETALIGIRPMFDDVVPEGSEASFSIIALDAAEQPTPMSVRWTINRVQTRYQWYQLHGNWNWEPITTRTRIAGDEVDLTGDALTISAPVEWGSYEVRVERLDGGYLGSSTDFYAGWYAPADASATPDTLDVSLDKPAYKSGETATLRLVPRHPGKALVTVMSNRLIDMKAVDVTEGENLITLPVTDEWGAGAYVTATVIRPTDVAAGHNPARALGLSYAPVDPGEKKLTTSFDMAPEAAPRSPFEVALRVDGVQPGQAAYATIAAVDLGILNLTGFESPDASGHYFGQRKLGMGMRDVYGRLIDGMNGALGAVRSGGDAGQQMSLESPPPTEELVAYFSGPVQVGADGVARTGFDLPEFNGTVRLMAVVWSDTSVGEAETDILVRDPVVVTASLPRFLAPGDESRMLLEIVHATGPSGRMGLDVSADGVALDVSAIPSGVTLADQQKTSYSIPLTAGDVGVHSVRVALTTPDGKQLTKSLTLPVVLNDPEITRTSRFDLAAGDTFTFDSNVFAGMRSGTGSATLAVGPLARFDAPGLLQALDRYPYGCTEQITSRALPLLYFDEVAQAMGTASRSGIAERVDQAIEEVLANQSSNGSFGLWRPDSGDFWLDAYVGDFLSRARAAGFTVPDQAFKMAMDNLRNQINYAADFDEGGQELAYALMVLAREGAAATGDLRYYADVKGDAFSTPLAAAQLGAALALYGDQTRADAMFARAARLMISRMSDERDQIWRVDYGTNLRDAAAVLALAVEAGSSVIDAQVLADRIAPRPGAQQRSTQEATWSLLAVRALVQDPSMQGFTIDGVPAEGPLVRVLEDDAASAPIAIRNGTNRDEVVTLTTFGVASEPVPRGGTGYAIDRLYFTLNGDEVDPAAVPVGSRLVTVLRISPFEKGEARLMVNDPLPAGFEIDNPNLLRAGDVRSLDWLDLDVSTRTTEFRTDRFLAAVDWHSAEPFELAYIVRAISAGSYHHPAASVEDMYRPRFRARTDTGRVTITE